jgi:amino acid adenylation domain-containing protein
MRHDTEPYPMIDASTTSTRPAPVEDLFVFPASFAQRRLWFLARLEPAGAAYNLAAAVAISGWLEVEALAASLTEVVRRHEALRTTFAEEDGAPVQVVEPSREVELPVVDLRGAGETEARRLAGLEAARPFDLERGPLLRASLLRLGEGEHRLVLVLHHIVADGRSLEVLVEETAAIYAALVEGRDPGLPEPPVQYADYTLWQQDLLEGERLASLLAWWRARLAGLPPALELPADRWPARAAGHGASIEVAFAPELSAAIRDRARREGVTVFMVLLAAFQALLSRLTGEDDLAVGVPVANRPRPELEGLVGFFVNTLVLRGDLSGGPAFRDLLARTREAAAGAFAHQELPFERLVEELAPDRTLGRPPLFQVMLGLQGAPLPAPALPGATARVEELETGAVKLDWALDLRETPGGIAGRWRYDRDRFEAGTVRRFARGLETLLAAAVADPGRRVDDLPLMTAGERSQVLEGWSAGPLLAALPVLVHERCAAWAERTPAAPAVVCEEERLTYAELESRANRLAHHLRSSGAGPERLVALGLERSADAIVAILAVHKAGAAYLPLDPEAPAARVAALLEEARPAALVTTAERLAALPAWQGPTVLLDRDREEIGRRPDHPTGVRVPPESLAYVLYTSGSTGRPKGVAVEHRHLASYLEGLLERLRMPVSPTGAAGASWATVSTLAADLGNTAVFGALATGGCLHVISRARATDAAAFADYVARRPIDCLKIVPSHLAALLEARGAAVLPRLRLIVGGEACDRDLADRLRAAAPECGLINHYGPTEVTVGVTTCEVGEDTPRRGPALPLGRPLADTRTLVLDRQGRPVPPGVRGEIFLGGGHVARGYLGRPDLTAGAFVPDPWSAAPGARLYRTGDLGRWLPEGLLEFLGRADHQVKIRGFRVELGEVEAALAGVPRIARALVMARPGAAGGLRLVAYLVPSGEGEIHPRELRASLGRLLPEAMIPSAFVLLDSLPLTPNGKVDRRALPEPEEVAEEPAAARGAVEDLLASLWAGVLGVERVGRTDSFFALGGHSLLAVRLQARVAEALGRDLPLRELFEAPTPAALAERLQAGAGGAPPPPVRRRTDGGPAPLSFAQERLWFLDQLAPGRATYNLPYHAELSGPLDTAALESALSAVVSRHEVLRATFPAPGGAPVQETAPVTPFGLPRIDLAGLPAAAAREEAGRIGAAAARAPFDLARGPLLRGRLLALGPVEHRLLIEVHHIACDAWSREVLTRELAAL